MRPRNYIYVAVAVLLLTIIVYVVCFYNTPLSEETTDWGAFGNYIGMGISILSVTLIYITYNEQRHSNRIERFEQHLKSMTDTLSELVKKDSISIEKDYQSFLSHFMAPFDDISDYEAQETEGICTYYLSQITYNKGNEYQNLFKYITLMIKYIIKEKALEKEEKEGRVVELSCILPESLRTFYFCWLLQQEDRGLLEYCYSNGLFVLDDPNDNLLSDVIRLVCTGTKPKKEAPVPIDPDNIELEDYSNEPFNETYKRLFNNKKVKS